MPSNQISPKGIGSNHMSYSIPYNINQSIQERDFSEHMNELLSEVLVSSKRMTDLIFSDTKEILQLIENGSVDDND
jgi:hypothetical protein